jgi:hypothetical protein
LKLADVGGDSSARVLARAFFIAKYGVRHFVPPMSHSPDACIMAKSAWWQRLPFPRTAPSVYSRLFLTASPAGCDLGSTRRVIPDFPIAFADISGD